MSGRPVPHLDVGKDETIVQNKGKEKNFGSMSRVLKSGRISGLAK